MSNLTNTINFTKVTVFDLNQFVTDFGEEMNNRVVCNQFYYSKEVLEIVRVLQ